VNDEAKSANAVVMFENFILILCFLFEDQNEEFNFLLDLYNYNLNLYIK